MIGDMMFGLEEGKRVRITLFLDEGTKLSHEGVIENLETYDTEGGEVMFVRFPGASVEYFLEQDVFEVIHLGDLNGTE